MPQEGGRRIVASVLLSATRGPREMEWHPLDVGPSYGSRFEELCYRNLSAYTIPQVQLIVSEAGSLHLSENRWTISKSICAGWRRCGTFRSSTSRAAWSEERRGEDGRGPRGVQGAGPPL